MYAFPISAIRLHITMCICLNKKAEKVLKGLKKSQKYLTSRSITESLFNLVFIKLTKADIIHFLLFSDIIETKEYIFQMIGLEGHYISV